MEEFKKNSHFVPKMYLREWSRDGKQIQMYRLLVSSEKVPHWKLAHIKGIARHEHLYTRIVGGSQSDEFERWIEAEFESPATTAINAVVAGRRLSKDDWWNLVRFLAAQDLRTPARLLEGLKRWRETVPQMVEEITMTTVRELEQKNRPRRMNTSSPPKYSDLLPIRVSTTPNADGDGGVMRVETDIGRGYWLFQIKHLLSQTARVLHGHRWSLMVPPNDMEWITTDDPVIKLNYQSEGQFDFGGGWGSPGTEILMPVSPRWLMYTKIGQKGLSREIHINCDNALRINRMIARHAHRAIFATEPTTDIAAFRPRLVDIAMVEEEKRQWSEWASANPS